MAGEDVRLTIRFGREDFAVLDAAAESCGVETGGLVREAALRSAAAVARDVSAGRVRLRRRSSVVPVLPAAASSLAAPDDVSRAAARGRTAVDLSDPGARAAAFRRATQS